MSRSVRAPWFTDGYKGSRNKQFYKRYANKLVRRAADVPNGKAYRKFADQWSICDYRFMYDPNPRVCSWGGKIRIIEPSPIWRVARK